MQEEDQLLANVVQQRLLKGEGGSQPLCRHSMSPTHRLSSIRMEPEQPVDPDSSVLVIKVTAGFFLCGSSARA